MTGQFLKRFPDADAARRYLEEQRWHGKPICPHCGNVERIQTRKLAGYFRCLSCKTDFTVRTGTILERSHVPLDKWLYAMHLSTSSEGISSVQLAKEIGTTQTTAWLVLQRLHAAVDHAQDDDGNSFLRGIVEAIKT